jgi:hypothetical protein
VKLGLVVSRLCRRSELGPGAVDAEWIAALRSTVDSVELYVDQASHASEGLRRAGVPVWLSPRRWAMGPDGRSSSADQARATALLHSHRQRRFDALVAASDTGVQPAWLAPALREIPFGIAPGAGAARDLRATWTDEQLFAEHWPLGRCLAGELAEADYVVAAVHPAALGLRLPEGVPVFRPLSGALPGPLPIEAVMPDVGSLVVVATAEPASGLESLIERLLAGGAELPPGCAVTVIVRAEGRPSRALGTRVATGCPRSLRRQVVVVSAAQDGVAFDLLSVADGLVLASAAELIVPAVADAAMALGYALLDGHDRAAGELRESLWDRPLTRRRRGRTLLVAADHPAELAESLEWLSEESPAEDFALLHSGETDPRSLGLVALEAPCSDFVLWGRPDAVYGTADPTAVDPSLLGVRQPLWRALARLARGGASSTEPGSAIPAVSAHAGLAELVRWCADPRWLDRIALTVLPGRADGRYVHFERLEQVAVQCPIATPILPPPRFLPLSTPVGLTAPAPVPLPGRASPVRPHRPSLETWARRTRWHSRLRLSLPWRFGLLERAMRELW